MSGSGGSVPAAVRIRTHVRIDNISTQLTSQGTYFVDPPVYLWSVFFKVDGDHAHVNLSTSGPISWSLQGAGTVVPTPGDQGDLPGPGDNPPNHLPGGVYASYGQDEKTPIPSAMGDYITTLTPFPVPSIGKTVGGMTVGWVGILLNQQNTPAGAVAAGHGALNSAAQQALDGLIPKVTNTSPTLTTADITGITSQVESEIVGAIVSALSVWDKIQTVLNTEFQDTYIGTAVQFFSESQLLASPPQGIPIQYSINWGGALDPKLYTFTFNGSVVADTPPFSLRRVMIGMGHTPPVGVRKVMGRSFQSSLLGWIEIVR